MNEYHEKVQNEIIPLLADDEDLKVWLRRETDPIPLNVDESNPKDVILSKIRALMEAEAIQAYVIPRMGENAVSI